MLGGYRRTKGIEARLISAMFSRELQVKREMNPIDRLHEVKQGADGVAAEASPEPNTLGRCLNSFHNAPR